jgi:hypothetical protein
MFQAGLGNCKMPGNGFCARERIELAIPGEMQGERRGQPDTVPLRLGLGQRQRVKTLCRPHHTRD